jgi:AcrR family transcriptional regulator
LNLETVALRRRCLSAPERRQQIIEAVFGVVSDHGIQGTTVARVAHLAGVGIGTVYRYFADQKAMFCSAFEVLSERLVQSIPASYAENALEQLRAMADRQYVLAASNHGQFSRLWLDFISANEQMGFRETVLDTRRGAVRAINEVCERGKEQGTIRRDADTDFVAYRILEQAWGVQVSVLMGLDDSLVRSSAARVMQEIIESIAVDPPSAAKSSPSCATGPSAT